MDAGAAVPDSGLSDVPRFVAEEAGGGGGGAGGVEEERVEVADPLLGGGPVHS